jgi:hypothetical protein
MKVIVKSSGKNKNKFVEAVLKELDKV